MSKDIVDDYEDLLGPIESFNANLEINEKNYRKREGELAKNATFYMNFASCAEIESLQDLVSEVYEVLEDLIPLPVALEIVDLLDRYASMSGEDIITLGLKHELKELNGVTTKQLFHASQYIRRKSIWAVAQSVKTDADDWKRLLLIFKIASNEHSDLIPRETTAHLALLRFYVAGQLEQLEQQLDYKLLYAVILGISSMEVCSNSAHENFISSTHSFWSKKIKKGSLAKKGQANDEIISLAQSAWEIGCPLLHTQMEILMAEYCGIKIGTRPKLITLLKDCAPANRKYGSSEAIKKGSLECPCDRHKNCPVYQKYRFDQKYDLPVTRRWL